jgi:hypothetical protein
MKKALKSISMACVIIVLLVGMGCGSQADAWVNGQLWGAATGLTNFAVESLLLVLFPNLGSTTITTTTTLPAGA